MTIGDVSPTKKKGAAATCREIRSEKAPLLPTRKQDDEGEEAAFHEFNGASFSGAVFNLSTTIVGAGIMALPATMKVLGLIPGIAMIVIVAFLTEASIEMLIRFSNVHKVSSYGLLMGDSFGKIGRIVLQCSVVVNNIGVMIVYMIIMGMFSKVLLRVSLFALIRILFVMFRFLLHGWYFKASTEFSGYST